MVKPEIKEYMLDNGDGTYSYSFKSLNSGKLSILVYLENLNSGVYVEIWDNISLSGAVDKTTRYSNINKSWTSGFLTSHYSILCSGRYTATLSAPINDTSVYFKNIEIIFKFIKNGKLIIILSLLCTMHLIIFTITVEFSSVRSLIDTFVMNVIVMKLTSIFTSVRPIERFNTPYYASVDRILESIFENLNIIPIL